MESFNKEDCVDFIHPFTSLISGATGCGKTYFVKTLLESQCIQPQIEMLIYCYGQYQPLFDIIRKNWLLKNKQISFIKGVPKNMDQILQSNFEIPKLLIIDDLMNEVARDPAVSNIFTKGSHHLNTSIMLLTQNLFQKGPEFRTMSLNSHYMIVFKNPRDRSQICHIWVDKCFLIKESNWLKFFKMQLKASTDIY